MGKVEKWVVLGVLALIVGILVVSLTVDDPLRREKVVMQGGAGGPGMPPASDSSKLAGSIPAASVQAAPADPKPTALMNSSVSNTPEPAPVVPETIPPGSILKTTEGLEPSFMPDTRFYTWKAGDTFPALAQRYYGDLARLATLRRVNEGRTDVQPGDRVMIPVFDPDLPSTATPSSGTAAPAAPAATPAATAKTATAAPKVQPAASEVAGSKVHVVKEGESLWIISKKELGAGSRWKEIYDANRDQLSSPEAVHTGLKLRIP